MGRGIAIETELSSAGSRRLARGSHDANQARPLLARAAVLDGMSRAEAAWIGGMDRQILCDWLHRFNAQGVDYLERSVWRLLHDLGFSHISARPGHPGQDPEMLEAFKKSSPGRWRRR